MLDAMLISRLLYISLLLLTAGFAWLAQRRDGKRARLFVFLIVLLLTLVSGLRGGSVGIDTEAYRTVFQASQYGLAYSARFGVTDGGFLLITYVTVWLFQTPQAPFVVFGAIINGLIVVRLYELRRQISFPLAMLSYVCLFYPYTFNIMRQCVAVAMIFYASQYLTENKYIKFICVVLLAMTVHTSAIAGLGLLFVDFVRWKRLPRRVKKWLRPLLWLLPLLCGLLAAFLFARYAHLMGLGKYIHPGLMIPLKMCYLIVWYFMEFEQRLQFKSPAKICRDGIDALFVRNEKTHVLYYAIGLCCNFAAYYIRYFDRVGLYFSLFELIVFGMMAKRTRNVPLIWLFPLALCLLYFWGALHGNGGQGQLPYLPFWLN